MTEMKRITVAFPEDIDRAVYELRKDDRFVKCSYSEIIRRMVALGLEANTGKPVKPDQPANHAS